MCGFPFVYTYLKPIVSLHLLYCSVRGRSFRAVAILVRKSLIIGLVREVTDSLRCALYIMVKLYTFCGPLVYIYILCRYYNIILYNHYTRQSHPSYGNCRLSARVSYNVCITYITLCTLYGRRLFNQ